MSKTPPVKKFVLPALQFTAQDVYKIGITWRLKGFLFN